jgi:SAM-dependent methyltransferase
MSRSDGEAAVIGSALMSRDLYTHRPRRPGRLGERISRRALFGLRMSGPAEAEIDYAAAGERLIAVWDRAGHVPLLEASERVTHVVADLAAAGPADSVLDVRAGDRDARTLAAGMRLPYDDGAFDAAVSTFGASYLPDVSRVMSELVHLLRPGGRLVLAAWSPRGLPGGFEEFAEGIESLPQGVPSPSLWGAEAVARDRMAPWLDKLELRARSVPLRFEDADAAFEAIAGATPLSSEGQRLARPAFDRLLAAYSGGPSAVEIRARYLLALGRKRATRE